MSIEFASFEYVLDLLFSSIMEFLDKMIFLLVISFLTSLQSEKVLSKWKNCGDQECATAMSRVQANKDYTGPDCRYLNFKVGEEIIVYSKLSRKQTDLWVGSKGKDFGYFPKDAVKVDEVFITQEVEVPTKETDFLCLDGGEYSFENKDSLLYEHDEDNEYSLPYTNQKELESKELKVELQKHASFLWDHEVELDPANVEADRTSEDLHMQEETTSNEMSRKDKSGNDDAVHPEAQSIHPSAPTQATWTVSSVARWLNLGSKHDEETTEIVSQSVEENTFRSRKIAVADESDLKELNEEDEPKPMTSGWFQSGLTDFLYFSRESIGHDLPPDENDPHTHHSSSMAGHSDHEFIAAATETSMDEEQQQSDKEDSDSSWFNLGLPDVLTFGHAKKDKTIINEEQSSEAEDTTDKTGKMQSSNQQETEFHKDRELKKQPYETTDEKQTDKKNVVEGIIDSDSKTPSSGELPTNRDTLLDFKSTSDLKETSSAGEVAERNKLIEPYSSEQDSVSESQVLKNTEVKERTQESENKNGQSDISNKIQLLEESKEKHRINTPLNNENNNAQSSEGITIPLMKTKDDSSRNIQLGAKKLFTEMSFLIRNYIPSDEEGWIYQILLRLNALDIGDFIKSVFSVMATVSRKVVAALPEDMRPGPDLYGFSWEMVICAAVIGIFTVFLFLCRSFQSVKSRFYVGREKQLANKVAELVEEKCEVLEKLSLHKKEYEDLELSLKNANLKESTDTTCIEETYEKLNRSNLVLKHEIENLEKELEKEKSKRSEQDEMITEIERRIESLEDEAKSIQTQVAEANTTLKVFHINTERLKTSVQDAVEENYHLQESEKQLLQEAEGWGERFSELNEQTKMFESSKADMEEALKNKESQVKSLTECLLKMKDWSSAIREDDATEDSHWDTDTKGVTENGEHLDDQQKRTVKKLIYAAKLNACLKTLETERNQVYSKLDDENKAKEELAERIENLQSEQVSLQSENVQFESEVQKLQQKLKVMTELYQENEMKLHRRLTVEERERLQKEEKLSKVDEKINHAAEELNSYRQRAKDLEEELEKTIRSYQSQITSHEKKAHDNWLTARAAERHLNDIRKENAHSRQKLTETEFKVELLEKDPFALDVPVRPFGREHSPYGPSPMGRPSSETRAFLSPPTLLEGPLRLSPILPGGGGRGSRGPGNPAMYEGANERGELISDRLSDPHRPPSDTGSLSPPWDRDRRIILPPTGQPYNDPALPPRRPERFYSSPPNSGRLSGPAELRSYNLQPFDKPDGQASSENSSRMESSGNGTKDHPNLSNLLNVSNQSLASESEAAGSGFAVPPIPQIRAPLIPVDPRGPFIRRGPPFPPPPPPPGGIYGPREYFPMRDFAGLPRPPLAMRSPFPPRPFSQYPPQRAGFFSPPSLPLENRNELTSGLTHQLNAPATEHPEPQQET
ncbi:melanoma inhibitory activity protein 2 isoform X2 [Alligator mississippiensis]|uniref:melanoma inhibitory activity protein 2 isoform X2 n=1 Tax=Alligator mississippiensis TaxID=8496 RepID=UPI000711E638|nr:melanoma inhibitory activity protein 2 isoform X2 [Alligator mississippiensis]